MGKFITGGPPRYAHQRAGLQKMIETQGVCALLYEPGTGKTATTLDFASLLALKIPPTDGVREARVLVIAPLAAVDTWVLQAETYVSPQVDYWAEVLGGSIRQRGEALAARGGNPWSSTGTGRQNVRLNAVHTNKALAWSGRDMGREPVRRKGPAGMTNVNPKLVLEVVNIDAFSSRATVGSGTMADFMMSSVRRFSPDLIVIDESHKIKGHSSNVSRLLGRIGTLASRRIILTGTVMPHSPLDVFAQWRFLEPYAFGKVNPDGHRDRATFTHFRGRYAQMGGFMGKEVVGFHRLDEMQQIMAKNSIVAKKEDALDLPAFTDVTVKVNLSTKETKAYADMKKNLAIQLEDGATASTANRLTQMLRLRQITSGHLPLDDGTMENLGGSKVEAIKSIVHDTLAGEKRIVIFCLFRHELKDLAEKMKKSGTIVEVISGDTSSEQRMAIRKRFGSDSTNRIVLIAQIKTLSLAVNELVTASHAIFGSLSQQRDDYIQARDRLNRIGQTRPITFWHAVAPGTIDEVILQSHRDRTNLETAILNHIRGTEEPGSVLQ